MMRIAIFLAFLVPSLAASSKTCNDGADCHDPTTDAIDALMSVNLLQHAFSVEAALANVKERSDTKEEDDALAMRNCKSWCSTKVEKAKDCAGVTCTWDIVCLWAACSTCSECPTTTTTTLEPSLYCSGASLFQKKAKLTNGGKRDFASKVKREDQAMLFHHSYCGRAKDHETHETKASNEKHQMHGKKSNTSSSQPNRITKGSCDAFTSLGSPNGLAKCDSDKDMPYAYAYHLHPTYDSDSKDAAIDLQEAFKINFGVTSCQHVDEQTTYSTKEKLCFLSYAKNCWKSEPESPDDVTAIFPMCQFGIYVRGGAMFDTTLGADGTSPWQWMTLNKDCFGADIDVLSHAVLCPSMAHGQWAIFVNGTKSTTAAAWITGDNSVDGCYGQECQPAECEVAQQVLDGDAVYAVTCCAVTALDTVPLELDEDMARTYSNVLKFQTDGAWWDAEAEEMKDYGAYEAVFPSTVWPEGKCHGVCTDLE